MKILIVAATLPEIAPLGQWLDAHFVKYAPGHYQAGPLQVSLLISGVGMAMTAYAMGRVLALEQYDLLINAGVAGALQRELAPGEVVQVQREYLADLGAEDADGRLIDPFELGLLGPNDPPFSEGWLVNPIQDAFEFLPAVDGITVNTVHGSSASIAALRKRLTADVESMEGAAFFYACLQFEFPFLEIRAISNYVEARQRDAWQMESAINNLNEVLKELIGSFH